LFAVVVAVETIVEPLNIFRVTLELASAVPVNVGVGSFEFEVLINELGGSGAVVSTVMEREEDLEETLPAESVADALIEYVPSEIAEEGVNEKAPLVSAVVVPKVEESINIVTLELGSVLPDIVGFESSVSEI
jgi:hypothetical protein